MVLAELPRIRIDRTAFPTLTTLTRVLAGQSLQSAINAAKPGDTLMLAPGAKFGAVTLPKKVGDGWITITTDAVLPPFGRRMTAALATQLGLARIEVASNTQPVTCQAGAHHYRLLGVEVSVTGTLQAAAVALEAGGEQPHHISIDRCYIHGAPTGNQRRGVTMHGQWLAVLSSTVSAFKEAGADSQAIVSWDGDGPLLVWNNYLEAAGENLMFGGADPRSGTTGPSDVEVIGNHLFKPLSWMGSAYTVKNLLELKNVRRILIEGNVAENNWANGQNGFGWLITPRNQDGTAPQSGVQDVTWRYNRLVNSQQGLNVSGEDDENTSTRTDRVEFYSNALDVFGTGSEGRGIQVGHGPRNVIVTHNTWTRLGTMMEYYGNTPKGVNFVFQNNIIPGGAYGMHFDGCNGGAVLCMDANFDPWTMTHNAIIGASAQYYPAGNFFPASIAGATQLGNDGNQVGVDAAALARKTAATVSGDRSSESTPVPTPTPVPVDCVLSDWGPWTPWVPIDATTERRRRARVIVTAPANGGAPCGALEELEDRPVVVNPPPPTPVRVDCVMTAWATDSDTTSFGVRVVKQTRAIVTPPANGGAACGPRTRVTIEVD